MTAADDHRRAGRLMKEARSLALDLIDEDVWATAEIVVRTYPLVEYAAKLWPKHYSAAETRRVLAGVDARCAQLAAAVGE